MCVRRARVGLLGLTTAFIPIHQAAAHEIVGNRFFPATLEIDDPGVNDELSIPTVDAFNTGDVLRFGNATFRPSFPNGSPRPSRSPLARPIRI